jgi:hypothetical protein
MSLLKTLGQFLSILLLDILGGSFALIIDSLKTINTGSMTPKKAIVVNIKLVCRERAIKTTEK